MEVELGVFYTLVEFRQNPMPSEQKSLFFRLNNKTVNCDIGEVEATKFRPVKIKVQDSDNSEGVWAMSDDKLIIFCASDLKQWVTSYTGAGDVWINGVTEDRFDAANVAYRETNTLRNKNPFDNREIVGVQYLTQNDITIELDKYGVEEDELALLTVTLQKQTDDMLKLQNEITERTTNGYSTRAQEAMLRMLNMQIDGTNRAIQSVRNSRALNDTLLSYDHKIINNVLSPPLNVAIESEDFNAVELLVSQEDPNLTDGYGRNALHWVAEKGCTLDILNTIMKTINDFNAPDEDGMTALMYAAMYLDSNLLIMNSLLEKPGIDINRQNMYKNTALHCAIEENNENAVVRLLRDPRIKMGIYGVDNELPIELLTKDSTPKIKEAVYTAHNTAYTQALNDIYVDRIVDGPILHTLLIEREDYNIAALFLYEDGPNNTDKYGMNALHMVAIHGAPDYFVMKIIHQIKKINATTNEGFTALMYASRNDHQNVVILLLDDDHTDPNIQNGDNWSALHIAASEGKRGIASQLLSDHRIDTTLTNSSGETAYQIALKRRRSVVIKTFEDHMSPLERARVKYQGKKVPLNAAVHTKDEESAEALLDDDEDPNKVDRYGQNALHMAAQEGCSLPLFHRILGMIHNVNAGDNRGYTALMFAVEGNHLDIVTALMNDPGIDLNARDKNGLTALMLATLYKHLNMVVSLLNHPTIDVNVQDHLHRYTALHEAVLNGLPAIVTLLLKNKININIKDSKGRTALDLAKQYERKDIINIIERHDSVGGRVSRRHAGVGNLKF
jgi:ankyrin repeat protein